MKNDKLLLEKLEEYYDINKNEVISIKIKVENLTLKNIKDTLITLGNIDEEDLKNELYVGYVKVGLFSLNTAHIVAKKEGEEVSLMVYSKEGIVKQNISMKAIEKFEKEIKEIARYNKNEIECSRNSQQIIEEDEKRESNDELKKLDSKNKVSKKNGKMYFILVFVFCLVICIEFCYVYIQSMIYNTIIYNNTVNSFNKSAEKFNLIAKEIEVDNVSGITNSIDYLKFEDTSAMNIIKSVFNGNNVKKIQSDINLIKKYINGIEEDKAILNQLKNPTKEWVINKLRTIDIITNIGAVTKENDPNGLYKKDGGGYDECIYFALSNINQNEVEGNTIIDKGTDAGGAVEIYRTKEEAQNRCEYLSEWDSTILYSGSYAIIGTMIVRVSYILTNVQQCYVTDLLFKAFTSK